MTLPTTPSQTIGPFFSILLPLRSNAVVAPDAHDAITIVGRLLDGNGEPVADALVETWQADGEGIYPHPEDARYSGGTAFSGYGRCLTGPGGAFSFTTLKPRPVPGFDERMQAPHINVSVFARGLLQRLATRLYFPDETHANENDPVLRTVGEARRDTLIATPAGPGELRFDIRLRGKRETVFFDV